MKTSSYFIETSKARVGKVMSATGCIISSLEEDWIIFKSPRWKLSQRAKAHWSESKVTSKWSERRDK